MVFELTIENLALWMVELVIAPWAVRVKFEPSLAVARMVMVVSEGLGVCDGVGLAVLEGLGVDVAVEVDVGLGVNVGVGIGVGVAAIVTLNTLLVTERLPSVAVMVTLEPAELTITAVVPMPLTNGFMALGLIEPAEQVKEGEPL